MRCAAAVVVAIGLLGSCSSGDAHNDPLSPRAKEDDKSPAAERVVCLDGRDAPKGVDPARPAVAVKIENSPQARPQSDLDEAEVVYEEIVEGGITRFMAIFHCSQSKRVGPVRSARFDDPKLALPFTRVLGYSGSNLIVDKELDRMKLAAIDELSGGTAFFREPPGSLDIHSLFVNTLKLRAQASKKLDPPREVFEFGASPKSADKARRITLRFTESNTIEYRWRKGAWRRYEGGAPFLVEPSEQVAVPNVLVQQVEVNRSPKIVDGAGNPSPDIKLLGKGRAWLFRDGRVVKGRWRIKKEGAPPRFETFKGEPFRFDLGPIWVELIPSRKGAIKGFFEHS